jgi:kynurenine formamidase
MNFIDLTMPLSYQWMPDEVLPTSVKFFLGPKDHQEKGIVVGSDTGTCLTLPAVFADFRKTSRLHELPVEKLVLRSTTVATIPTGNQEEISRMDIEKALHVSAPAKGDALLVMTGWGDRSFRDLDGGAYVLQSPHFSLEAAKYLGERMRGNASDLLMVDTALLGWPGSYLIPEWCSMLPPPPVESGEARMYLHLYNTDKAKADFAVEMEFARLGIMTVRKLVRCGQIKKPKVKVIVAPLQIVRGVAAPCRVVAVED